MKSYGPPLLWFFFFLGAYIFLSTFEINWLALTPASCMPDRCFCELIRPGTVRQWANSWSNFAFVLVGAFTIGHVRNLNLQGSANQNKMNSSRSYSLVFAIAVMAIGLTSWFYHASLSFIGQWFDVQAMYLLALYIILYNLARLNKMKQDSFVYAYLWANAICGLMQLLWPESRRYLFGGLLGFALALEFIARRKLRTQINNRFLDAALLFIIFAFIIWILDIRKILCDAASLWQGHAFWHIFGALSAGCMYLYYSSEKSNLKKGT